MFIKHNILGIIWTITIVVVCGIPGDNLPESSFFGDLPVDKVIHFIFYFVLFILSFSGLKKSGVNKPGIITAIYCIAVGIGVELMQTYIVKGRAGDIMDVLANLSGTIIAWLLYNRIENKISFLKSNTNPTQNN